MLWKKKNNSEQAENVKKSKEGALLCSYSIRSDTGMVRDHNEDAVKFVDHPADSKASLAILADGMGGHRSGEVASKIAVETIAEMFYKYKSNNKDALKKSIKFANDKIWENAQTNEQYKGMGTTCSTFMIKDKEAYFAHVGDSRIYLYRKNIFEQLTEDHTIVNKMLKQGSLSADQASNHPQNNVLWQALGTKNSVEIDVSSKIPICESDRFLLCSDGLTDLVKDIELRQLMEMKSIHMITSCLIALAKDRGGYDNISVILLQFDAYNELEGSKNTREIV